MGVWPATIWPNKTKRVMKVPSFQRNIVKCKNEKCKNVKMKARWHDDQWEKLWKKHIVSKVKPMPSVRTAG